MTFTEFLTALAQALDEYAGWLAATTSPAQPPIPRVIYDPGCQQATAPSHPGRHCCRRWGIVTVKIPTVRAITTPTPQNHRFAMASQHNLRL
jgi:hypothetical protein